jgi:ABC-2 type transport system permease protein
LLQPIDSQFAVSTRQFGLDNVINAMVGIGIVVFSLFKLAILPNIAQIVLYMAAVCLGVTVHYSIMFFLATMSFWIVRAQGLIYGYYNLFNIARYPDSIFRGTFRFVFSWIIPVIIVANVPTRILIRSLDQPLGLILQLLLPTLLVSLGARAYWKYALRHYSSASS